jgi:hypothetical protein
MGRLLARVAMGRDGSPQSRLTYWFPALAKRGGRGLGTLVAVVEGTGGDWDIAVVCADKTVDAQSGGGAEAAVGRAARSLASRGQRVKLAGVLAAMGSEHRLRILLKLLEGAATYRTLQKATGLKVGPLYHHIAQLRLMSLVGPKQRDLYELTRAGRNVTLAALMLAPLAADRKRRPQPDAQA